MIIELKNINKDYYKNSKKIKVLENVNYKFKKGMFYCINGKSGSGKSTLIKLIGLILNPNNGDILINKESMLNKNDNFKCNMRNKYIGFIFQNYYLNPFMNVKENIELPMYINDIYDKEKSIELIKTFDLEGKENHFPNELSGGEQQRVAIARALINDPEIILADEPTGSLDYDNEENVMKILKKLSREGKCVIVVSHNPRTKKYADINLKIINHKLIEDANEE